VVWFAANGEVGIHVLGSDGSAAFAVEDMVADLTTIQGGGTGALGLDAATLQSLLVLDPFYVAKHRAAGLLGKIKLFAPLIAAPRFVPAPPYEKSGSGTGSGDTYSVSYDSATDDKSSTASVSTTITDAKPGWVGALFGGDNDETTTTLTTTDNQSVDVKTDYKVTNTVTMVSQDQNDKYDIKFFYDRTFKTFAFCRPDDPALQGLSVTATHLQDVNLQEAITR